MNGIEEMKSICRAQLVSDDILKKLFKGVPELIASHERLEKEKLVLDSACISLGAMCKDTQKLEEKIDKLQRVCDCAEELGHHISKRDSNCYWINEKYIKKLQQTIENSK